MNKSLVSIIIPTYNRAHVIHETLDSIFAQTYTNWECIIVDDGSTDNSKDFIKKYIEKDKRFQLYSRPKERKKGGNAARNFGFEKSSGEFIQWFDSDDLMHHQLLEMKVEKMMSTECDFCLCRMSAFYDENEQRILKKSKNFQINNLLVDFLNRDIGIGTPTVLWRRDIIDVNNIFDENLTQSQDLEFNSRMFYHNTNACIVNKVLIYYRTDGDSISKSVRQNIELHLESFLEVRKRILEFEIENKTIDIAITKEVLGQLRACLAAKKYTLVEQIITFLRNVNNTCYIKLKLERIFFFCFLFKMFGRGDTKFKRLLKL